MHLVLLFLVFCFFPQQAPGSCGAPDLSIVSQNLFPISKGQIIFHAYHRYGDGSSQIYQYDFGLQKLRRLSKSKWGLKDIMNAQYSPDGKWIVFMGVIHAQWEIFLWRIDSDSLPLDITSSKGAFRNEDPRFFPNGRGIVFKTDGQIAEMSLMFNGQTPVLGFPKILVDNRDGSENSMPALSPDGRLLYFAKLKNGNSIILAKDLSTGKIFSIENASGAQAYGPNVRSDGAIFYSRHEDQFHSRDFIFMVGPSEILSSPESIQRTELKLNQCDYDNSDPTAAGNGFVIFSSTRFGGTYSLFIYDLKNNKTWSINLDRLVLDPSLNVLGAAWSPM